ncbi:hypothetical protein [Oceanobacillus sp. CFH 90083]|uniref:hypothetical protein n=1 Tax=Oceanobacillus sp. CFH 90083 TaxID=2592336 RepID=UPI00128CD0CF|nr:hypothetical protein [Oceanobacillus sp. CFH 90083]
MGFKESFKKEMENATKDIDLSISKTWNLTYKGHLIQVKNTLKEESLFIDEVEVAKNRRKSIWSHVIPVSKLTAMLTLENRDTKKVQVKFSGLVQLHIQIKVGREVILKEKLKLEFIAPWERKEPIVPWIINQVEKHGQMIGESLPDEEYLLAEDVDNIESGYRDLLGYEEPTPMYVGNLIKLLQKQIENPTSETRKATYEKVLDEHVMEYGEELIYALKESAIDMDALYKEARWFLDHAAHREVVKFALLLVGYTNKLEDEQLLKKVGLHEEFTRYVIFSLYRRQELLWELADMLKGWGKVALMHELTPLTEERKAWFLKQSLEGRTKRQAVAITCAEKSEMDVLLYQKEISEEQLKQVSDILATLLEEDDGAYLIEQYEYEENVLKDYVRHAKKQGYFEIFPLIKSFLNERDYDIELGDNETK